MLIVGETGCQVYRDSLYYPCNFSISLKLLNKKFKKETKLQIKLKTVKKKKKAPIGARVGLPPFTIIKVPLGVVQTGLLLLHVPPPLWLHARSV